MANGTDRRSRHFIIEGFAETQPYRSPQQFGGSAVVPVHDCAGHARTLQRQFEVPWSPFDVKRPLESVDARYALVVSIKAPEVDVDLRTAVAIQIGVPVEIET